MHFHVCIPCNNIVFNSEKYECGWNSQTVDWGIWSWCHERTDGEEVVLRVHRGWCEVHDESLTGHPKVVTDESVNTIRALLNKDRRLRGILHQCSILHTTSNVWYVTCNWRHYCSYTQLHRSCPCVMSISADETDGNETTYFNPHCSYSLFSLNWKFKHF